MVDGTGASSKAPGLFGLRAASEIDIKARIEESRKELLDLSLRNRLLNCVLWLPAAWKSSVRTLLKYSLLW